MLQVKNLPDDVHAALAERARSQGTTMSEYVARLIRRDLARPSLAQWVAEEDLEAPRVEVDVAQVLDEARVEYDPTGDAGHGAGSPTDPRRSARARR